MSNSSPAELFGIVDHDVAFAFNVQCAEVLNEREMEQEAEREKRQFEAIAEQAMTGALGGLPQGETAEPQHKVNRW